MRIENLVINCTARYPRTCRRTPFEVVVYELNYSSEDKDLMDLLRTKAEELARQVNPGAANNSMHERSPERILADCIAGVVSEYFWKYGAYNEAVFSMVGENGRKALRTKGFKYDRENGLNISKRFFSLHGLTSALRLRGFSADLRGIALHRACRWD